LTFGTKVVILTDVGSPSFRVSHYNLRLNDEGISLHLDLLQEKREASRVIRAIYQQEAAHYFNKKVNPRNFQVEDWVGRKVILATKDPAEGKLAPKWEGPYQVVKTHPKGAYRLETIKGKQLPRSWNEKHLNKYYL
jgi:hypothetical protein